MITATSSCQHGVEPLTATSRVALHVIKVPTLRPMSKAVRKPPHAIEARYGRQLRGEHTWEGTLHR